MKHFFIICFLSICYSFGQNFQLIDTSDYKQRKSLIKLFETKHQFYNEKIKKSHKGQIRREILNFHQHTQASVIEIIESKKLFFYIRFQNCCVKNNKLIITNFLILL